MIGEVMSAGVWRGRRVSVTLGLCGGLIALLGTACTSPGPAPTPLQFVNQVRVSPRLVTAGQPTLDQLRHLREAGVDVVLHIRSGTEPAPLAEEPALVQAQGIRYFAVAVDPNALTVGDQRAVFAVLGSVPDASVLVHCEMNILAAAFVFLHRVLVGHEDQRPARADLERMNLPPPAVRRFIEERLREAGLAFDDA